MQRPYEIRAAFVEAIQLNQAIAMSALTASLPDCGDKTTDDSENRYWILSNMGRVVLCDFVKAKFKFPGGKS
jgi:nitrogen fixation protein FixH